MAHSPLDIYEIVSIQLISPASGEFTGEVETDDGGNLVSIQLISPASGELIITTQPLIH